MKTSFRAAKNRSQGREGWCVIFHHPLLPDTDGKFQRLRKGLRTSSEQEADLLVSQLNTILADDSYWTISAKERAAREVDPRIVSIFYDKIESKLQDPWSIRDAVLPIPSREEGYSRVLVLGQTGAGKTTLLRQFIGTTPQERFPSTSTAKTTVFDIEIITAAGPFRTVVSFLSDELVRSYIEECLVASVSAAAEQAPEAEVIRRFFEHSEQRFRLNYLLGNITLLTGDDAEEDDENSEGTSDPMEGAEIVPEERRQLESKVRRFMERIQRLGADERLRVAAALNYSPDEISQLKAGDRDCFFELLEQNLLDNYAAQSLIDDIFDEIRAKFDGLDTGTLQLDRSGWPISWTYECSERELFLKTVNRFSSNHAANFGRLLTPLVSGLRASGPFSPTWVPADQHPKVVLMDGEGLGHTAALNFTLPTSLTRRYDRADVILLADSAKHPMQAGAIAVLRSLAATGHDAKLCIVFTHYDQLEGDNLATGTMKKHHVLGSLENALQALEQDSELSAIKTLRRHLLDNHVLYVSNIHKVLPEGARATRGQLIQVLEIFEAAIKPAASLPATPMYDVDRLAIPVGYAAEKFHQIWNARLNLVSYSTILFEHWTRIKALTRRLAYQWSDSYDTLRPVADLIRLVTEQLDAFIAEPRAWIPAKPMEEAREEAIRSVRQELHSRLHDLAAKRIFVDQVRDWMTAYEYRGRGSTVQRAGEVRAIFEDAAPLISDRRSLHSKEFLEEISKLFDEAVKAAVARSESTSMSRT
jgi:GTPase Era involved in 16S rRNA processing